MTDDNADRTPQTFSRRQVLQMTIGTGAAIGLAGCLGGGGDGGGSGTIACTDLTNGYEPHDSGEIAFVFDLELPAIVVDNAEYDPGFQELDANTTMDNEEQLVGVTARQSLFGGEPDFGSEAGESETHQSGTLSFKGEDRPVWVTSGVSTTSRVVELPYEVEGEPNYFKTDIIVGNQYAEATEECMTVFEEVAQTVVMSLTPNDDTTIASEMETYD